VAGEGAAEFGRIAQGRGEHQPETEFQAGLRKFSMLLLLVQVAGVLTGTATGLRGSVSSRPDRGAWLRGFCIGGNVAVSSATARYSSQVDPG
jgi:hypothetical protein